MLTFFSGCAGLFTHTFNDVCQLEVFEFMVVLLLFEISVGLFFMFYRGLRKF